MESTPDNRRPRAAGAWLAWLVLGVSLSASVWGYQAAESELSLKMRHRFDGRVDEIKTAIRDRIQVYEQVLQGARGLFAASQSVERHEWREYLASVNITKNYPGIKGVGFVSCVPRKNLESFLAAARLDGAPDFKINPPGARAEYFVMTYFEPLAENSNLLGYDIGADTLARRAVAELSRDRGRSTISGKIVHSVDTGASPDFVFLLPVYRPGAPIGTVEERRASIFGWIYCPFDVKDLMKGIVGGGVQDIDFEIYDGIEIISENLLYATRPDLRVPDLPARPSFADASTIEVGERVWMLNFLSRPEFDATADRSMPILVLLAGFLGSLLIFSITWSLIATRRLALSQAESMTAKLRSVLETASEAFIAMDASGDITDWNRQAEETFGWTRAEALGRRVSDLIIPPKYREAHTRGFNHFLSTGEGPFLNRRIELSALRRDGSEFPVEIAIWAIRSGDSWTFNAFVHDIAERRQAQKELLMARYAAEGASRAKSEFLANMSHELRAPLNSMIGFARIIESAKGNLKDQELAYLDRILENGNHLLSLINEILDLSKVEARQMKLDIETIYLEGFILETIGQMESRVLGKDLKLTAEIPRPIAPVETDATKLKQILINLISNAIKFTDRGRVTVRVEADPETLRPIRIDVADTGMGIPKDKLELIFAPFQQVEGPSARQYAGGTGLGLTISRSLCQLMGYRLEVESEVGKGSTFSIFIPQDKNGPDLLDAAAPVDASFQKMADATDSTRGVSREDFAGRTALVIDDEPDSRLLLTRHFEDMGLRVVSAGSGEQGAKLAREKNPDLITVDIMMRGKNGWDVVEELKKDPAVRDIPVIVISNIADDTRKKFQAGVDLLNKPVDPEDLMDWLMKNLRPEKNPKHL